MNIPDACEKATAAMIRKYGEIGPGVLLRCWQSLRFDRTWNEKTDRQTPYEDIRFAPERVDENQSTMICEGVVVCATKGDDDKDHSAIKRLYEETHKVMRDIFADFRARGTGGKYDEFKAAILEHAQNGITIGGVTFTEPAPPFDESGTNSIGIGFAIRFFYA